MNYDKTLFQGTHQYYAKYRPGIPHEAVSLLVDHFALQDTDNVLDMGCGTGQMALALHPYCGQLTGIDQDPELLKEAERVTRETAGKTISEWIQAKAEDIGSLYDRLAVYKLVTFCRSFHWMDQEKVILNLDPIVTPDGGLAIMGDGSFWTGEEPWQKTVKKAVKKYLGEKRRAGRGTFNDSQEPWEATLARSPFSEVMIKEIPVRREWSPDSIVGWLFSSSFASPVHFGKNVGQFENEIRAALKDLNPEEIFQENVTFQIIFGKRL
jgi:SAM-dependent methyltransferase